MTTIFVDGKEHDLGILKHWRKSPLLNRVLPRGMDVSLAWVRLEKDQVLDIHVHPVDSMVVCCQGQVRSIGDVEIDLDEGDIIVLPTGCRHGFVGAGEAGFWGISIQFESLALYEDLDSPLVTFIEPEHAKSQHIDAVTLLLQKNEHYLQRFRNHPVFALLEEGYFENPTRWFEAHADEGGAPDLAHVKMGVEMLRRVPLAEHAPLIEIQQRGWQMFTTMFDRMVELAR